MIQFSAYVSDAEKTITQGACSRAAADAAGITAVVEVVSRERKARATARKKYFFALWPLLPVVSYIPAQDAW